LEEFKLSGIFILSLIGDPSPDEFGFSDPELVFSDPSPDEFGLI